MKYLDARKRLLFATAAVKYVKLVSKTQIVTKEELKLFLDTTLTYIYGDEYTITNEDRMVIENYVTAKTFGGNETTSMGDRVELATKWYSYLIHKGTIDINDKNYLEISNKIRLKIYEEIKNEYYSNLIVSMCQRLGSINQLSLNDYVKFKESYPTYCEIVSGMMEDNHVSLKATNSYMLKIVSGITSMSKAELYIENLTMLELHINDIITNSNSLELKGGTADYIELKENDIVGSEVNLESPIADEMKVDEIIYPQPSLLLGSNSNIEWLRISDVIQNGCYAELKTEGAPEPPVPSDYQAVSYIYTTTNGSYINTNYLPKTNSKFKFKINSPSTITSEQDPFAQGHSYNRFMLSVQNSGGTMYCRYHACNTTSVQVAYLENYKDRQIEFECGNGYFIADGKNYYAASYSTTTVGNLLYQSSHMTSERYGNYIYLFGNYNSTYGTKIQRFDIINKTFTTLTAELPRNTYNIASAIYENKIYLFGGANSGNIICIFNADTETIETLSTSLTYSVETPGCAIVGSIIYLFGGSSNQNRIQKFDVLTNTVTVCTTTMPYAGFSISGEAFGTDIYLFGGTTNWSTNYSSILKFDTLTETITTLSTTLPSGRSATCSCLINNYIYIIGGYVGNTGRINDVLQFNPLTSSISKVTTMPTTMTDSTCCVVNDEAYIFGGMSLSQYYYLETLSKLTTIAQINIVLFNDGSTSNYTYKGRMYYFDIYEDEQLIKKLIPCRRIADDKVGFYDEVNEEFLTGNGFIAGPDV